MKTRAAIALALNRPLEIKEIDHESPKGGEVLVRIGKTSLCHTDVFTLSGEDPKGHFPYIFGHEGCGIVEEVGKGVTSVVPATSGLIQKIVEMRIDNDQDAVWLRVAVEGGASCHVGYRSCFYRAVPTQVEGSPIELNFTETEKIFEPLEVYGDAPNPTQL